MKLRAPRTRRRRPWPQPGSGGSNSDKNKIRGSLWRRTLAVIRVRVTLCATSSSVELEHSKLQIGHPENKMGYLHCSRDYHVEIAGCWVIITTPLKRRRRLTDVVKFFSESQFQRKCIRVERTVTRAPNSRPAAGGRVGVGSPRPGFPRPPERGLTILCRNPVAPLCGSDFVPLRAWTDAHA
jgi:hypothetical protein